MQFTEMQDSAHKCSYWFDWFASRGIPAAILSINKRFYVYRKGMVGRKAPENTFSVIPAPETGVEAEPVVVMACHGYLNGDGIA